MIWICSSCGRRNRPWHKRCCSCGATQSGKRTADRKQDNEFYYDDVLRVGIVAEFDRASACGEAPTFTLQERDFMDAHPHEDFDEIDGGSLL